MTFQCTATPDNRVIWDGIRHHIDTNEMAQDLNQQFFQVRRIYIINTINNSSENNKIGELILTILVSLEEKSWNNVHPQHLIILLESFKKAKLDNLLKDLIIEIFQESKII